MDSNNAQIQELQCLHNIVFDLLRLDLRALEASHFDRSRIGFDDAENEVLERHIHGIYTAGDVWQFIPQDKNWFETLPPDEFRLMKEDHTRRFVESFPKGRTLKCLRSLETIEYLPKMLQRATSNFHKWSSLWKHADNGSSTYSPDWYVLNAAGGERDIDLTQTQGIYSAYRSSLRSIHKLVLGLRTHIEEAMSSQLLDNESLHSLQKRMSVMQDSFHDICDALEKPKATLLWADEGSQ
jgi:hypothetical protein